MRPDVLFADEPTGALDSRTGAEILELMRECTERAGPHDRDGHARPAGRIAQLTACCSWRTAGSCDHMVAPTAEAVAERMTHLEG